MKPRKLISRALVGILFAAGAAETNAAESWYQDTVKTVYPLPNGDFVVTFVTSPAACLNASNPKYFHVQAGINGVTVDGVKSMLATALTAFVAGKRLTVVFNDASTSCDVNRMVISD
jgi:ABC-type glycerol-3-phosphate transport system substrate-binding protein